MRRAKVQGFRPPPCGLYATTLLGLLFAVSVLPSRTQRPTQKAQPEAATVRVSVLSLFHPKELILTPQPGSSLKIAAGDARFTLAEDEALRVQLSGSGITVRPDNDGQSFTATELMTTADSGGAVAQFSIEVPGKLKRRYTGSLSIAPHSVHATGAGSEPSDLEAIVTMPLETAVASVVAAESPPGAGLEAMKAQAVASRSFLVARQSGHVGFDFCDTTHCQFLRSPPPAASLATKAALATRGLVLIWHDSADTKDQPLAAMYARSCGGRTRSLREIGVVKRGYPYYAVSCAYCRRHPEVWRRQLGGAAPRTEHERLLFNRIHGWAAMPSLTGAVTGTTTGAAQEPNGQVRSLTGRGVGHGMGLCQLGAADMARRGASFDRILAHYYPNTRIATLPAH